MTPAGGWVVVERPRRGFLQDYRDRLRSYVVEIDGEKVGRLRLGKRLVVAVSSGRHVVQTRINWTGSPPVPVDVPEDGAIALTVHSTGGSSNVSDALSYDQWLTLRVSGALSTQPDSQRIQRSPTWWDFNGRRRRLISDRTWFGTGLLVIAVGNLIVSRGWVQLALLPVAALGVVLICSGVKRALSRTDPDSGRPRPSRPW